jgi:MFS family permease
MDGIPSNMAGDRATMNRTGWRLVLLLMAICFLAHFNRISMAVAGDARIMARYDLSTAAMGTIYSAFLVAYTLFMIPGGWLIDWRGPRFSLAVVCFGSAVFIVLTASVGLASSALVALPLFLAIRASMGMLSAPLHPAAAKAVGLDIPLNRRSGANGLVTGAALLGIASTYIVFGRLIDWFDWPGAFLVAASATAVLGWLWARYGAAAPSPSDASHSASTALREPSSTASGSFLARHKNLILLTLSYAAVGYFQYLFFYWMHYYFESVLELGADESRRYATAPPLAMALGMPLGGWLSDRIQSLFGWRAARAGLVLVAMTASAILLWIGVRATEPAWIVTWLSLALGVLGMAEGPFWVTAVEVGGRRGGLSAAVFNTGGNAGGILAPVVTPWVSDSLGYGWQSGISLGSVVCLLGAACWIWIDSGGNDRHRAGSPAVSSDTSPTTRASAS